MFVAAILTEILSILEFLKISCLTVESYLKLTNIKIFNILITLYLNFINNIVL